MIIIVDHGLSDVKGCLTDEVFEFLPATVGWDLFFSATSLLSCTKYIVSDLPPE